MHNRASLRVFKSQSNIGVYVVRSSKSLGPSNPSPGSVHEFWNVKVEFVDRVKIRPYEERVNVLSPRIHT